MELADVCEGRGQLWQRTAMGFQLIFVLWLIREPGGVAPKRREARHGDPHYRSTPRPLIRSELLIRSPRVASLRSNGLALINPANCESER
jgi:hypothetical protein